MTEVHIIQTGYTLVSPAVPDRSARKSPLAYTGLFERRSKRIKVPVKCFLIESGGRRVLVDTGWSERCVKHPLDHLGFGLWFASEPLINPGEGIGSQLDKFGVRPSDLDAVLMTHLDCDHISGVCDVSGAKAYYVSEEELEAASSLDPRYNKKLWEGVPFKTLNFEADSSSPFERSCDLLGDGNIICHFTPTHSKGSICIEVFGDRSFALITGDNAYNRSSWEDNKIPGPLVDEGNMHFILGWIDEVAKRPECAAVLTAHDPEVSPETIEF